MHGALYDACKFPWLKARKRAVKIKGYISSIVNLLLNKSNLEIR